MVNFQVNPRNRLLTLKRRWVWILLAGVLAGGATYLGTQQLPEVYCSESTLSIQSMERNGEFMAQETEEGKKSRLVSLVTQSITDANLDHIMREGNFYSDVS